MKIKSIVFIGITIGILSIVSIGLMWVFSPGVGNTVAVKLSNNYQETIKVKIIYKNKHVTTEQMNENDFMILDAFELETNTTKKLEYSLSEDEINSFAYGGLFIEFWLDGEVKVHKEIIESLEKSFDIGTKNFHIILNDNNEKGVVLQKGFLRYLF